MKKSRYTEEQVAYALRLAESGTPVADVCRQIGIAEATFYLWKKKYGGLGVPELRELRQMREENARLKRLVADLTLDKQILQEVIRKNVWSAPDLQAVPPSRTGPRQCIRPVDGACRLLATMGRRAAPS
jgi:putative transposase